MGDRRMSQDCEHRESGICAWCRCNASGYTWPLRWSNIESLIEAAEADARREAFKAGYDAGRSHPYKPITDDECYVQAAYDRWCAHAAEEE